MSTRVLAALTVVALAGVWPATTTAQTPMTVSFGFATLREQGPGEFPASVYEKGWALSGAYPVGIDRLQVAAELGRQERVNFVEEMQELTAGLVGARYLFARSGRLTAFGHALIGVERFVEPGFKESGLAFQPGVGLDYGIAAGAGVRIQGDYRMSRQGEATFKDWRFFVGGVYAFRW